MSLSPQAALDAVKSWYQAMPATEGTNAILNGFLWALSLVSDLPVEGLRQQVTGTRPTAPQAPAPPPEDVTGSDMPTMNLLESEPPWPGLGIKRIPRVKPADLESPVGTGRAFTTGPNGRPIPMTKSYSEMAAENPGTESSGV